MPRILAQILLFIIGVMLSLLALDRLSARRAAPPPEELAATDTYPTPSLDEARARLAEEGAVIDGDSPSVNHHLRRLKRILQSPTYPQSKRIDRLTSAVQLGEPQLLGLLEPEFLSTLPRFREELFPALEREALRTLVNKLTAEDFLSWPESIPAEGINPAKAFVKSIAAVNPDLGRFTHTAAYLLHRLFVVTEQGVPFQLPESLAELLAASPNAAFIDSKIMQKEMFISVLETVRGDIVRRYLASHADLGESVLPLVASLRPEYCTPEVFTSVKQVLTGLSLKTSPDLRAKALSNGTFIATVNQFAQDNSLVSKALADLYLTSAVDNLETGNVQGAMRDLEVSEATFPGLETQKTVREVVAKQMETVNVAAPAPTQAPVALPTIAAPVVQAQEEGEFETTPLAWILLLFFAGVGIWVYRSIKNRTRLHYISEPPATTTPNGQPPERQIEESPQWITPPGSVSFYDEEETSEDEDLFGPQGQGEGRRRSASA